MRLEDERRRRAPGRDRDSQRAPARRVDRALGLPLDAGGRPAQTFASTFSATTYCDGYDIPRWTLFDITGDGRVDVVVTDTCLDDAVGSDYWMVYPGSEGGFRPGVEWPLPAEYGDLTFATTFTDRTYCDGYDIPRWSLVDLNGDALVDVVATSTCGDAAAGVEHWRVNLNDGSGFGPFAVEWPLPTEYSEFTFDTTGSASVFCDGGYDIPLWSLLDLTGDGLVDVVATKTCTDAAAGVDHWLVNENTGSGFAPVAAEWALPTEYGEFTFDNTYSSSEYCDGYSVPRWSLFDLTGDGFVDVVATTTCTDPTVGEDHWLVNVNDGVGFAAAVEWALPIGYGQHTFGGTYTDGTYCDGYDVPHWGLIDLTGDGRLDVVATDTCSDDGAGTDHWLVNENLGGGFAPVAVEWGLPTAFSEYTFDSTFSEQTWCDGYDIPAWSLFDITGDGMADVVATSTCGDAEVGVSHWVVFRNVCEE